MKPFFWRLLFFLGFIFIGFFIANIIMTILFLDEVENGKIDHIKLDFIYAANWIYVGIIGFAFLFTISSNIYIKDIFKKYDLSDLSSSIS